MQNQKGQIFLEYVLLMVLSLGLAMALFKGLKKMEFLQSLTMKPWSRVDGMAQCGVWAECGIEKKVPNLHPNTSTRILSFNPIDEGGG